MMLLWLSYSYNCNSASLLAMGRVDALCLCVYWFDSLGPFARPVGVGGRGREYFHFVTMYTFYIEHGEYIHVPRYFYRDF